MKNPSLLFAETTRLERSHSWPGIEQTPGVQGGDARIVRTRIPIWTLEAYRRLGLQERPLPDPQAGTPAAATAPTAAGTRCEGRVRTSGQPHRCLRNGAPWDDTHLLAGFPTLRPADPGNAWRYVAGNMRESERAIREQEAA